MTLLPAARRRVFAALGAVAVAAVVAVAMVGAPAAAAEAAGLGADGPNAVAGSYIVVLKDSAVSSSGVRAKASGLATKHHGRVGYVYTAALRGFSATLSPQEARRLAADPAVAYVERDSVVHAVATQSPVPSWVLTASTSATAAPHRAADVLVGQPGSACYSGSTADSCNGVSQNQYDYLKVFVQYTG